MSYPQAPVDGLLQERARRAHDADVIPPCAGRWPLFDSVSIEAHRTARALCNACPFILACTIELEATRNAAKPGYGPRGTWAGRLVGVTKFEDNARTRREDAAFTVEQARSAHAAWRRGERSAWINAGHNVYERRRKRPPRRQAVA